jgi:biotin operon repressor
MIEKIIELRNNGLSQKQISQELKISTKTIWKLLKSINMIKSRQIDLDHNYFSEIYSSEKAYFLGLIMADGCVSSKRNTLTLSLKKEDYHILDLFKSKIKSHNKISKTGNSFRITINSKKIIKDLKKLGCVDRKTYSNSSFPEIPCNYINDFIRGYFDGDGHISGYNYNKKRTRICYNFHILVQEKYKNFIKNYFLNNYDIYLLEYLKKDCKNNLYVLKTGKKQNITKIYDIMYSNSNPFLLRKKRVWDDIINNICHTQTYLVNQNPLLPLHQNSADLDSL